MNDDDTDPKPVNIAHALWAAYEIGKQNEPDALRLLIEDTEQLWIDNMLEAIAMGVKAARGEGTGICTLTYGHNPAHWPQA